MNEDLVIEVMRTGITPNDGHVCGVMTIKNNGTEVGRFSTLERGVKFTNLKVGEYEMHHSIKRKNRHVKCLRPTNMYISSVLIHDAYKDDANHLEGCIAPFLFGKEAHYVGSAQAMDKLWELIGGFDESQKAKITLRILNNVPGEKRTAAEWIAQREATMKAAWKKAHKH
jgi:hypothetical protein